MLLVDIVLNCFYRTLADITTKSENVVIVCSVHSEILVGYAYCCVTISNLEISGYWREDVEYLAHVYGSTSLLMHPSTG